MSIDARSYSLASLMALGQFTPARVQREYQWRNEQYRELLDDLLAAFQRCGADPGNGSDAAQTVVNFAARNPGVVDIAQIRKLRKPSKTQRQPRPYYLGGIILYQTAGSHRFEVYDGLQRLTTIALLLSKLREKWGPGEQASRANLEKLLKTDDGQARLAMPTPGATLASIVKGQPLRTVDLTPGDKRMRDAAKYFGRSFAAWTDQRRAAFSGFLCDEVWLTAVTMTDATLAYQTFVTANMRGLPLEIGEVLKGQLVDHVSRVGGTQKQIEAVADIWRTQQAALGGHFNMFIHAVEALKFSPADRHITGEMLAGHFPEDATRDEIIDWCTGEFPMLAELFMSWRRTMSAGTYKGKDIALRQLSFLGWNEWLPMFLATGLIHPDKDSEIYGVAIQNLQRACYMIELLRWSERKRRSLFRSAIEQLESGADPYADGGALFFPNLLKRAVKENLRRPFHDEDRRGTVVRWIETLHWGNSVPSTAIDDATCEHILPMSPGNGWAALFTPEQLDLQTNRLGNLFIFDEAENGKVGNSVWDLKKPAYEKFRTRFRGIDKVLAASTAVAGGSWTAAAIEHLTEEFAAIAEAGLGIRTASS